MQVVATDAALAAIERLTAKHGPLMLAGGLLLRRERTLDVLAVGVGAEARISDGEQEQRGDGEVLWAEPVRGGNRRSDPPQPE